MHIRQLGNDSYQVPGYQKAGERNASVVEEPSKKCEARSLIASVSDPFHKPMFMLSSSSPR